MSREDEIARAARELRRQWDSPGLWPRIAAALSAETERERRRRAARRAGAWLTLAAAVAAVAVSAAVLLRGSRALTTPTAVQDLTLERRLLTERALGDVERAEGEYLRAIEALSRLAEPKVAAADSPLLMSYREKLVVLDSAIAECRARIEENRFNARLRQELLSLYRDKQRTLQQVIEETDAL
jgi:hypothetical protein